MAKFMIVLKQNTCNIVPIFQDFCFPMFANCIPSDLSSTFCRESIKTLWFSRARFFPKIVWNIRTSDCTIDRFLCGTNSEVMKNAIGPTANLQRSVFRNKRWFNDCYKYIYISTPGKRWCFLNKARHMVKFSPMLTHKWLQRGRGPQSVPIWSVPTPEWADRRWCTNRGRRC